MKLQLIICAVLVSFVIATEQDGTREIRVEEYEDNELCEDGEVYLGCGSECPEACYNLGLPRACGLRCKEGCFCEEGLVRHHDGHCIDPQDCPKDN